MNELQQVIEHIRKSENISDKVVWYDPFTDRRFIGGKDIVNSAVKFAQDILDDKGYVTYNLFMNYMGVPNSMIGDEFGWNWIDNPTIEVTIFAELDEDGEPIRVFWVNPKFFSE